MEDQLAAAIIGRLDDLKNDLNRQFDLLVEGQRALHTKFETHEAQDTEAFNAITTEIATSKAAHDASASTQAKFWAAVGSVLGALIGIVGGIVGDWFLFGRSGH